MLVCGWCHASTEPGRCSACGRDPALPWTQRAQEPPVVPDTRAGRPDLDPSEIRERLREAREQLGVSATNAALAEHLEISERQLGRWRRLVGDKRPKESTFRAVSVTPEDSIVF